MDFSHQENTHKISPQIPNKDPDHQNPEIHNNIIHQRAMKQHSCRIRTPSFSSSSSLSSSSSISSNDYVINYSPLTTPASTPGRFSGGVPFSWEHLPGIPKKQLSKKINKSTKTNNLLPLMPPPTTILTSLDHHKKSSSFSYRTHSDHHSFAETDDPFFAALVECSKDEDREDSENNNSKSFGNAKFWSIASAKVVSRSLSDRFVGFAGVYSSCKRTCGVAESIRHLPARSARGSYDLLNQRSR